MWLAPVVMGTMVVVALARIAALAVEEELSLWLAGLLALLSAGAPTAVAIRSRRRYRARLRELGNPMIGSLSAAEAPAPLPVGVRRWLIATPVLAVALIVLVAILPGEGDTCVTKGIATATARDGICQRGANLFGGGVTYNVVDAGQILAMPGYQAQLLATSTAPFTATGPDATPALYPDHHGLLVSFELDITNDGGRPLLLPVPQVIAAEIPDAPGSRLGNQWWPGYDAIIGAPSPQLVSNESIPPGQSETGWVSLILPPSIQPLLTARLSDLEFYRADESRDYVGQIRLWKAANAAGNAAIDFGPQLGSAA